MCACVRPAGGRYGAVVRADQSSIHVGGYSSVGDRTVVQSAAVNPTGFSARTYIGDYVTIGSQCTLRACTVDDNSVVGDGCIIQEGALVDRNAMLLPGSLLPQGARVPSGEVYGGSPATFVRKLSKVRDAPTPSFASRPAARPGPRAEHIVAGRRPASPRPRVPPPPRVHGLTPVEPSLFFYFIQAELDEIQVSAEATATLAAKHADEFLPYGDLYQLKEQMATAGSKK